MNNVYPPCAEPADDAVARMTMRGRSCLAPLVLGAALWASTLHAQVPDSTRIPIDGAVTVGTLSNGLRYFVRRNTTPAARAELRLVVNAGSALEDDDQRGMAHFVEHMAFNGTTHFAKNALIAYIQSVGMRSGADLNAHTSYEETVYDLTVPTDSATLGTALTILGDWATGVQFDSANVVAERSVIVEEQRLALGAASRIRSVHDSVLYRGTPYLTRDPIGTVESIRSTNPAPLRRFYHDWYRPDLMTIVAVGDFDQAAMVAGITRRFGAVPMPAAPRPRLAIAVALPTRPTAAFVADVEQPDWSATIVFRKPRTYAVLGTVGSYRQLRIAEIFQRIVNQRLAQRVREAGSPLMSAKLVDERLGRGRSVFTLSATAKSNQLEGAVTAALSEIARIARDGVTAAEVEQQRKVLLRRADNLATDIGPQQSAELAEQYIDNARQISVSFSMQSIPLLRAVAVGITPDDIRRVARAVRADSGLTVLASAPQAGPTPATLLAAVAAVATAKVPLYDPRLVDAPLVAYPPVPGRVTAIRTVPAIGATEWILANGVRVLLKPMPNSGDEVYIAATRPGGFVRADSANYPSAAMATLASADGAGTYGDADIQRKYTGVVAGASTAVDAYYDVAAGGSGTRPEDLALMFQILYLKFTAPHFDTAVFTLWKQAQKQAPLDVVQRELDAFQRNGSAFGRPLVGAVIDSVDAHHALTFYRSRFGDAAGFTFIITGPFSLDTVRPLVEQYLGGLPSSTQMPPALAPLHDDGVRPRAGPRRRILLIPDGEPKSRTVFSYTTPMSLTRQGNAQLDALVFALQERLTFTLRQKLGGVYTVSVDGVLAREPYERAQVAISYIADPTRVETLHQAVLADLEAIKTDGPSATELFNVHEAFRRSRESGVSRPDVWVNQLRTYVRSGWPVDSIVADQAIVVTAEGVRDLARALFTDAHRIEVVTMPRP